MNNTIFNEVWLEMCAIRPQIDTGAFGNMSLGVTLKIDSGTTYIDARNFVVAGVFLLLVPRHLHIIISVLGVMKFNFLDRFNQFGNLSKLVSFATNRYAHSARSLYAEQMSAILSRRLINQEVIETQKRLHDFIERFLSHQERIEALFPTLSVEEGRIKLAEIKVLSQDIKRIRECIFLLDTYRQLPNVETMLGIKKFINDVRIIDVKNHIRMTDENNYDHHEKMRQVVDRFLLDMYDRFKVIENVSVNIQKSRG